MSTTYEQLLVKYFTENLSKKDYFKYFNLNKEVNKASNSDENNPNNRHESLFGIPSRITKFSSNAVDLFNMYFRQNVYVEHAFAEYESISNQNEELIQKLRDRYFIDTEEEKLRYFDELPWAHKPFNEARRELMSRVGSISIGRQKIAGVDALVSLAEDLSEYAVLVDGTYVKVVRDLEDPEHDRLVPIDPELIEGINLVVASTLRNLDEKGFQ